MHGATNNSHDAAKTGHCTDGFVRSSRDTRQAGSTGTARPVGWWTESNGMWCVGAGGLVMNIQNSVSGVLKVSIDLRTGQNGTRPASSRASPRCSHRTIDKGQSLINHSQWPELGAPLYGIGQWSTTYRGLKITTYTGGTAGQVSSWIRVPSRKMGFWIAVNDVDFGGALFQTVQYRILDDLLGLDHIGCSGRCSPPKRR